MKFTCSHSSILSLNSGMKFCLHSKWWSFSSDVFIVVLFITTLLLSIVSCEEAPLQPSSNIIPKTYREADITVTTSGGDPKKEQNSYKIVGKFGVHSQVKEVSGIIVHAVTYNKENDHFGCKKYEFPVPTSGPWISLVARGECNFKDKIIWAQKANASAIVIYNNSSQKELDVMNHDPLGFTSVLISKENGRTIVDSMDKGKQTVHMDIIPGEEKEGTMPNTISKTSVLFVSISFIVLMIISLAWLGFYYIQRFRYSHAKERLARRLACAAKKAIAKIPQKTIKSGDKIQIETFPWSHSDGHKKKFVVNEKELENDFDQCAVCIEPYKAHDVIRMLPCRHIFHKSCVDPWLLDQRSCPMCKLDILRAYGMQVGGSQESVRPDPESSHVPQRTVVHVGEPEASSSVEEAHNDEIKVLLVPHMCLHFHSGKEKSRPPDEASSSLFGASGGPSGDHRSCSIGFKTGGCNSRVERCDEEAACGGSELKALLQQNSGEKEVNGRSRCDGDDTSTNSVDISYKECCQDSSRQSNSRVGSTKRGSSALTSPTPCDKDWDDSSTCSCVTGDSEDDDQRGEHQTVSVLTECPGCQHSSREPAA